MTLTMKIAIVALLVIVGVAGISIARYLEKREYNNGVCRMCGHPLILFDSCYNGDRGYKCLRCHYTFWISYNVDGKRKAGKCG